MLSYSILAWFTILHSCQWGFNFSFFSSFQINHYHHHPPDSLFRHDNRLPIFNIWSTHRNIKNRIVLKYITTIYITKDPAVKSLWLLKHGNVNPLLIFLVKKESQISNTTFSQKAVKILRLKEKIHSKNMRIFKSNSQFTISQNKNWFAMLLRELNLEHLWVSK